MFVRISSGQTDLLRRIIKTTLFATNVRRGQVVGIGIARIERAPSPEFFVRPRPIPITEVQQLPGRDVAFIGFGIERESALGGARRS